MDTENSSNHDQIRTRPVHSFDISIYHLSWPWPLTLWPGSCAWQKVSWWAFVPKKTQHMLFENSSMHQEVMAWTSLDTHRTVIWQLCQAQPKRAQQKYSDLSTKHNTSMHKHDTVQTSKFWYFYLIIILKSIHVYISYTHKWMFKFIWPVTLK
jgi:hypothetical protein